MDNCYCLIRLILRKNKNIVLYFFRDNDDEDYPICLTAYCSDIMYKLICSHNCFGNLSLEHYLYLGKELYKAQIALELGQEYIQN